MHEHRTGHQQRKGGPKPACHKTMRAFHIHIRMFTVRVCVCLWLVVVVLCVCVYSGGAACLTNVGAFPPVPELHCITVLWPGPGSRLMAVEVR